MVEVTSIKRPVAKHVLAPNIFGTWTGHKFQKRQGAYIYDELSLTSSSLRCTARSPGNSGGSVGSVERLVLLGMSKVPEKITRGEAAWRVNADRQQLRICKLQKIGKIGC